MIANLDKLNRLRNQLEHYALDADRDEVVLLIKAIRSPILNFFEKHLGSLKTDTPSTRKAIIYINSAYEQYKQKNHNVAMILRKFNGQEVPRKLFGTDGTMVLPIFEDVGENVKITGKYNHITEVDVLAQSPDATWMVEIKPHRVSPGAIYQVVAISQRLGAVPWIISLETVNKLDREMAEESKCMITGPYELEELKKLIELPAEPSE